MEMKERYLDWSYSSGGYKKARKTFMRLDELCSALLIDVITNTMMVRCCVLRQI